MSRARKLLILAGLTTVLFVTGSVSGSVPWQQASDQNIPASTGKKSGRSKKPAATQSAPFPPSNSPAASSPGQQSSAPAASRVVWVNTKTGAYHKPSSRWYGKTKQGKYMTEADAVKAGYRAARNEKP